MTESSVRVKLAHVLFADAAGQHRNVIDVSIINHGGESVLGIMRRELVAHMFFPKIFQELSPVRGVCSLFMLIVHIPCREWMNDTKIWKNGGERKKSTLQR